MAKKGTIILKLGGSVITEKTNRRLRIRKAVIRQITKELFQFIQQSPLTKIILLHGAGSFGHPLVYRYQLLKQPLSKQRLLGFAKVVYSVRQLTNFLAEAFQEIKLPVLPLQTSAMVGQKKGSLIFFNFKYLKQIIDQGFIPSFGGDIIIDSKKKAIVVSADQLAVSLAQSFTNSRLLFATNVDGVFNKFPPSKGAKPFAFLSRRYLKLLLGKMKKQKSQYDVTGGMAGKLQMLLALRGREVVIFNGLKHGCLGRALTGKPIGTRLKL